MYLLKEERQFPRMAVGVTLLLIKSTSSSSIVSTSLSKQVSVPTFYLDSMFISICMSPVFVTFLLVQLSLLSPALPHLGLPVSASPFHEKAFLSVSVARDLLSPALFLEFPVQPVSPWLDFS